MKKVYIVLEVYTFECATDTRVSAYEDKEKAYDAFRSRVAREKKDSWIGEFDEEDLCETYDELNGEYDCYVDGRASEFETTICVEETEVW